MTIISYTWQNFYNATKTLAADPGTPHQRLIKAVNTNLITIKNLAGFDQLPQPVKERYQKIIKQVIANGENWKRVEETINKMDNLEVDQMIGEIVAIYDAVTREYARSNL